MTKDEQLRQSVLDELRWDSRVDASHVAVTAAQGAVTLTGHVASYPAIFQVREAVRRVQGVRAVADNLQLKLSASDTRDDSDIALSIAHVLEHNINVANADIKADVSEGRVTLTGEVQWQHQRSHVETQVAHVRGVQAIINQITLRPTLTPEDVRQQISDALARNAELEAAHIHVSVEGDVVTLTGNVKAFYERNLVEAASWHAPGVHKVIDNITVG